MTDVWELAAYVEAHPTNHEQRWRLAKKLYTSWEYRLALEHLLILKNELEPRENVMRYLAATYYRLGRYDESAKIIEDALALWPKDSKMLEQLARTQAEAGHPGDALKTWRKLHREDPQHPFAGQAITRLEKVVERNELEKGRTLPPGAVTAIPGTGAAPPRDIICPKCGEKNTPEFRHCWKCNTSLAKDNPFAEDEVLKQEDDEPRRFPYPMVIGTIIAALVALAAYSTMRGVANLKESGADTVPLLDVGDFMNQTVFWTRIILGAVLLIVWPIAWRFGAYLTNVESRVYNESLYQAGAVLALLTYSILWAPWGSLLAALAAPVLISAFVAFIALKLKPADAFKLWIWQLGVIGLVSMIVIVALHGPALPQQAMQIAAYGRENRHREKYTGALAAPGEIRVQWKSTGSTWLDRAAGRSQLVIEPAKHKKNMFLDTILGEQTQSFEPIRGDAHTEIFDSVNVRTPYRFDIRTEEPSVSVGVTIYSLLPFTVELVSKAPPPAETPAEAPPATP